MKKTMMLAVAALFMFSVTTIAKNETPVNTGVVAFIDEAERTPVKLEELPEPVKKTLAGDAYKGWEPSEAFLVKGKTEYYEIVVKKEAEAKTIKLSKDGVVVE